MDFNYPDFLNETPLYPPPTGITQNHKKHGSQNAPDPDPQNEPFLFANTQTPAFQNPDFDRFLHSKLGMLDARQDSRTSAPHGAFSGFDNPYINDGILLNAPQFAFANAAPLDSFHLPRELQGGIGNISSRRPSYAAESFTRNGQVYGSVPVQNQNQSQNQSQHQQLLASSNKNLLASFAAANNFSKNLGANAGYEQLTDSFVNFNLNSNFSEFQARRPSQVADFQVPQSYHQGYYGLTFSNGPVHLTQYSNFSIPTSNQGPVPLDPSTPASSANYELALRSASNSMGQNYQMKLDNKLVLKNQHILLTAELKLLYASVSKYYQDPQISQEIVAKLKHLLHNEAVLKLITFIKDLNNLNVNHKMLCLVMNKNGKLDLLSYPNNSNIYLQNGDMVIVDGDRGKDLVMVLEPLVLLDLAILFNFLKKIEHLRSLTIVDSQGSSSVKNSHWSGIHSTSIDASTIVNSHLNEDNEFIINLPTKQVLRFATPKEIHKLSGKFLEEKKAFVTCFNKNNDLGLSKELTLVNVEYQFDFKKLIFYYFADFKRIDFRDLIKSLFKIYKTRIWLCAVLPYDKPELYTLNKRGIDDLSIATGRIPKEYDLVTEKLASFSVDDFEKMPSPSYFHLRNMSNLIDNLEEDVKGSFYGFNLAGTAAEQGRRRSYLIQPSFNPFGETERKL